MRDAGTKAARIFIIDDHPVVRQGLRLLFMHAAHIVCGEAESLGCVMERLGDADADIAQRAAFWTSFSQRAIRRRRSALAPYLA